MQRESSPVASWRDRLGVFMIAAACVWAVLSILLTIRHVRTPLKNSVFPLFYEAGQHWNSSISVYSSPDYRYTPIVTSFFAVLSYLPLRGAAIVWYLLNLTILLTGFIYWARVAWPGRRDRDYICVVLLAATPMMIGNLNNLQANPLVLGLMLIAFAASIEKKFLLCAACAVIIASLKIYPLAAGLLLLLFFPLPMFWRLVCGLSIAFLVPFFTQSTNYVWQSYADLCSSLSRDSRFDVPLTLAYKNAALIWRQLGGPLTPGVFLGIQLGTAAAVAGLTLWIRMKNRGTLRDQLMNVLGLLLVWIMLFGPATESATYILLAPLPAWQLVTSIDARWPLWQRIVSACGYGLLVVAVCAVMFPGMRSLLQYGVQPMAAILSGIVVVARLIPASATESGALPAAAPQSSSGT